MFNMRLKSLARKLFSLGLKNEARKIVDLDIRDVFAHISGPSGSGKSTLMEEILSLHPDVIGKDLDEFDEKATEKMGLEQNWKQKSWSEDLQRKHYKIKQAILNDFIDENIGSKILLVGFHSEGDDSLVFNARYKIILNTDLELSMKRRIKRDKKMGAYNFWDNKHTLHSEMEESKKIVKDLKSEGYILMSRDQILSLF